LFLIGLIGFFIRVRLNYPNTKLELLTGLFLLAIVISSILGVDWQKSLWGNYYRRDGIVTYLHLVGLFFFISLYWRTKYKEILTYVIALGSFLTSVWSIILGIRLYVFIDKTTPNWQGAIGGFFNQPNFLAGYLLVSLPFVLFMIKIANKKIFQYFWFLAILLQIGAIGLTYAWAGLLGVLLFILLTALFFSKNKLLQRQAAFIFVLSIITLIFFYGQSIAKQAYVAESRQRIIYKVLLASLNRPVLGWGWANVDYAFNSVNWPIKFTHDIYVDKAHGMLLEVLTTTGIVGLVIYIGIIIRALRLVVNWIKSSPESLWPKVLLLSFILYLFHSQTNVISIAEEIFFWLILGIIAETNYQKTKEWATAATKPRQFLPQ
jgi:O-antigen ligase